MTRAWSDPRSPRLASLAIACVFAAPACDTKPASPGAPIAPATVSVAPPTPATGSVASATTAAPEEPKKPRLVPTRKLPLTNGAFACARFGPNSPFPTTANEIPDAVIARDQRAPAEVAPNDEHQPRVVLPLSQVGLSADKKALVLVEARDRGNVKMAKGEEAPHVAWFTAGKVRPLAPRAGAGVSWRLWNGEVQPAVEPDVLAIEDAGGKILALRYLGAQRGITPLAVDPAVPMFLVTVLESASGADDEIALTIVGLVDGDLKELLVVEAGHRSSGNCKNDVCEVIGPPGSLSLAREGGPILRARRVVPYVEGAPETSCYPGQLLGDGCAAEDLGYRWNASTRAFEAGPAKRLMVKQDAPNKPIRVVP